MAHRKKQAPRRGSLAYLPRGRASRFIPRIKNWPEWIESSAKLLGFIGFKAGMSHAVMTVQHPNSPFKGQERVIPVTILDTPPIRPFSIRGLKATPYGHKQVTEVLTENLSDDLRKTMPLPKEYDHDAKMAEFESHLDSLSEIRMLIHTQPRLAGVAKKKPDICEYKIGAPSVQEAFDYAKEILGTDVRIADVLNEGVLVDSIAVTKGHGFQGPVRRWGVRILQHKSRKTKRGVGCIGPWSPTNIRYSVPRPGQTGFHTRTSFNNEVLRMGERGEEITPPGGFVNYGVIRGDYAILWGSIPGTVKRPVRLRFAIRPSKSHLGQVTQVSYVSTTSKQ
ncbi:MAG: 50S ribosomal protein L3 [Candidatus Thorarchaeota archaeon]|nr:MAG: 50S ribosomal protein L3 [Candidatus Thorarchaeota archaeon]